ncbi:MAG TPA: SgcJ/EcaC family oxidoreductase [Chitinophaga sp.]|uniref:YybH family protein n=1 Tax=Chitinophaga sp. TaxID=1869181 RepID=UPI002C8CCB1E|nr:SgcJ/EcaC family oxidoreductase [Chitinophaga sp.]HVI44474.1 SgcJ/EcaC family oxidoreductase [Chitinophaga sp.]
MSYAQNIQAIGRANENLYRAFETKDFKTAAQYLTEDCDYITFNGMHLKGRQAYIDTHEQMMNNFIFRGAILDGKIEQIRFLNDTTAIVIATGAIRFRWQKKTPENRLSINTNIWTKNESGQWQLTAFQNTRVKKIGRMAKLLMKL